MTIQNINFIGNKQTLGVLVKLPSDLEWRYNPLKLFLLIIVLKVKNT